MTTNVFKDQEKFMTACDQSVTGDQDQFDMYIKLILITSDALVTGLHELLLIFEYIGGHGFPFVTASSFV